MLHLCMLSLRAELLLEEPVTLALTDPTVGVGTLASVAPSLPNASALNCANPTDAGFALNTE